MNIFLFLYASMKEKWVFLGCGQNETFEDVILKTLISICCRNNRKRMFIRQQDWEDFPSWPESHNRTWLTCVNSLVLLWLQSWNKQLLLTAFISREVLPSEPSEPFLTFALYLTAQMGCCVTCPWSLKRTTRRARDGRAAGLWSHWAEAPGRQHRTVPI